MPSLSDTYCGIEQQDKFRKKLYIYIYIYMYVCMYMYTHTHTHTYIYILKDYIIHRENNLHGRKTGKSSNFTVLSKTLQSVNASE